MTLIEPDIKFIIFPIPTLTFNIIIQGPLRKKISELSFITTGSLYQIYLCGVIKYFQISCKMTILQPVVLPSLGEDRAV